MKVLTLFFGLILLGCQNKPVVQPSYQPAPPVERTAVVVSTWPTTANQGIAFSIQPQVGQVGITSVKANFQVGSASAWCTNAKVCTMPMIDFFNLQSVEGDTTEMSVSIEINKGVPQYLAPIVLSNASFLKSILRVTGQPTTFTEPKITAPSNNAVAGNYPIAETTNGFHRICAANRTIWLREAAGTRFFVSPASALGKISC